MKTLLLLSMVLMTSTAVLATPCAPLKVGASTMTFTDRAIKLSGGKNPRSIALNEIAPANCVDLKAVEGSTRYAQVTLWSAEQGTSTLVSEKMIAVIDTTTAKWAVEPFALERKMRDAQGEDTNVVGEMTWAKSGVSPLLKLKTLSSGEVRDHVLK